MNELKIRKRKNVPLSRVRRYLRDIRGYPLLTADEEADLGYRAFFNNDETAKEQIVKSNLRFALAASIQYLYLRIPLEDLVQYANTGMVKAVQKWNPDKGFKFISFAVWDIRAEIYNHVSYDRLIHISADVWQLRKKVLTATTEYERIHGYKPDIIELSDILYKRDEKIKSALECIHECIEYDEYDEDKIDENNFDCYACEPPEYKDDLRKDLLDCFRILNERERKFVGLFYGLYRKEMSLEEIGMRYDLTRERVRQIIAKAIKKLQRPIIKKRLIKYL